MKAIIVGAGEVGYHIADRLSREGHDITIIERDRVREQMLADKVNALVIHGNGASGEILESAGIDKADLFIAVTDQDEVNLVACIMAGEYQVPSKIARIKSIEYSHNEGKLNAAKFGIDLLINPQTVVADEIFHVVQYTAASEVAEFADGRVVFLGYPISDKSPLAGISLMELGDIRGLYRLVITAINRGEKTIIPRGEDTIQVGDIVYIVCNKQDLSAIEYLFGFEKTPTRKVFILGGGQVGFQVASRMGKMGYDVKLIDRNRERCDEIADQLDNVLVLCTEGTDVDTLKNEGIADADVFAAVTNDDQANILCSLLAKRHGSKRAIALVNQPELLALAPSLGVDATISPRLATASAVLRYVRRGEVLKVAPVERCDAEVLELIVPSGNSMSSKKLSQIRFPRGSIVGALVRGPDVIIPSGEDTLMSGDHAIIFTLPEAGKKVEEFFA